jgi:hypothetical protein
LAKPGGFSYFCEARGFGYFAKPEGFGYFGEARGFGYYTTKAPEVGLSLFKYLFLIKLS